ncbi:SDR family oxidoreductase [Chitinophaga japonensis]|uniref:NADP-dependent 3-hydroxy acid dehydrogenase YdfG n=1 Tax=Chitinophaga japonensis TaxID=104662 RepID=A0A562T745_CHIJA|nr:SDR family oxidoreductase [Chitinophaga japonensis]TWI89312.1 NADP-dependent 3-hydroxy acid dehydrogenase YdfG [Chitinophaga japonensis]
MSLVILITGASAGLGASIGNYLHGKGYTVYGTSRHIQPGALPFHTLQMDVNNNAGVQEAIAAVIEKEGRIDVLVNNAGLSIAGVTEHLSQEDVQQVFDTNVLGVLRTCQAVLPHMRRQGRGLIINVSSIGSETGLPYRGIYSASKAAVDRFTEALRLEVGAWGIQACCLQPGAVHTGINAHRLRSSLPEDSPYRDRFESGYAAIDASIDHGADPGIFGPVIEKIIQARRVKRYYRVGKPIEKLSVILKKYLPERMFENLLRKYYNT